MRALVSTTTSGLPSQSIRRESNHMPKIDLKLYRRLIAYVRPYKGAVVASGGVGLTDAGYAGLTRPLVDRVILGGYLGGSWIRDAH